MERYANRNGNSGVMAFEIGSSFISVQFRGNSKTYIYSYNGKAGATPCRQYEKSCSQRVWVRWLY